MKSLNVVLTFSAKSISRRETFSHENVQVNTITHRCTLCNLLNWGGVIPANADYSLKLSLKVSNASASTTTSSDYALIIHSAFTITQSGWNEITEGITAKVSGDKATFDSGYKLTVTATTDSTLSAEGITDTISYTLKTASTDTSAATTWEFTADELNASDGTEITGTTKTLGIDVEDYSTKTNGDYSDTITFSAKVENKTQLTSLTLMVHNNHADSNQTFYYVEGETWRQAVNNHLTENTIWSIISDQYIVYSSTWPILDNILNPIGVGSTTIDTVIDSTKTWYF